MNCGLLVRIRTMSSKTPTDAKTRTAKGSVLSRVKTGSEHDAQQLEGLHQIGLEILEHAQPEQIIERALKLMFPLVNADGGAYWEGKSDPTGSWNELSLSIGRTQLPIGTRFDTGQGVVGEVFLTGEAVRIDDFLAPAFDHYPIRPVRSLMFVPLKRANLVIGVFLIANTDKIAAFDQNDLALLSRFATLVSIALENARLLEDSKDSTTTALSKAKQLEALHSLSLELVSENNPTALIEKALKLSVGLVGADAGGYWRVQKSEHREPYVEVILASENVKHFIGTQIEFDQPSLTVHVIQTARAALIPDYSSSIYHNPQFTDPWQSVVAVPLWNKDQIDGVFTLISSDKTNVFNSQHVEILERMAALCSVALENARVYETLQQAEQAAQQQNTLLAALHDANLELSASLEPSALLDSVLDRAMQLLNADVGRVYLVKPNTTFLKLESARGEGLNIGLIPFGQGLAGQIALHNKGFVLSDYETWEHSIPGAGSEWLSAIGVPLRRAERVIGTLVIADTRVASRFTNTDLEMLERFAALATVALENARLFDAAKTAELEAQTSRLEAYRRAQQLEAVYQTSLELTGQLEPDEVLTVLVERVANLFLADTGAVYFRVPGTDKIELKASLGTSPTRQGTIHHGLSGSVVRSGIPKFVGDYRNWEGRDRNITTPFEWRSAMSAPITREEQVIGALSIADTRFANRFSQKELEVLERFAAFASVTLENARLHEIERLNLSEERLRTQIAMRLSPLRSIPELCEAVIEELSTLGYERISLFLLKDQRLSIQAKRGFEIAIQSFSLDQGVIGRAMRTRQAQMIPNPHLDPDYLGDDPDPGAFICLPIHSGNRDLGVLNFGLSRGSTPKQADLEMLESLLPTISSALENAVLHSELEARASELELLRAKAEQAASHDLLTGLANRRALERELGEARIDGPIFTLAALDLTGFKNVNDQLGHDAGDNALKRIASVLKATLESFQAQSGMKGAFRVGGDEFFMLIPEPLPAAIEVCRNVLKRITSLEFPKNLRVSTNIGLAEYPTEAQNIDALFSLADTRMYAAKRVGKPFLEGNELTQPPKPKRRQSDRKSR
jgi:diguanylate cyclase (GGDEF)-like protein